MSKRFNPFPTLINVPNKDRFEVETTRPYRMTLETFPLEGFPAGCRTNYRETRPRRQVVQTLVHPRPVRLVPDVRKAMGALFGGRMVTFFIIFQGCPPTNSMVGNHLSRCKVSNLRAQTSPAHGDLFAGRRTLKETPLRALSIETGEISRLRVACKD